MPRLDGLVPDSLVGPIVVTVLEIQLDHVVEMLFAIRDEVVMTCHRISSTRCSMMLCD